MVARIDTFGSQLLEALARLLEDAAQVTRDDLFGLAELGRVFTDEAGLRVVQPTGAFQLTAIKVILVTKLAMIAVVVVNAA